MLLGHYQSKTLFCSWKSGQNKTPLTVAGGELIGDSAVSESAGWDACATSAGSCKHSKKKACETHSGMTLPRESKEDFTKTYYNSLHQQIHAFRHGQSFPP